MSHGFCSLLVADNGNVMLFDCGHNELTGFRPSIYLPAMGHSTIQHLIIHNFDQDHVSDLHNVLRVLPVEVFFRNRSITPEVLRSMKESNGFITEAMEAAINLHSGYNNDNYQPPEFPGIEFVTFRNNYPSFEDTNNLSLVSFIHYGGKGIVFTGDLEREGWLQLLNDPSFQYHLSRVNVFVASHHGRENGYCEEVFSFCTPEIIIISDKEIVHETQKQRYAQHASGVLWDGGPQRRYVLTTRSDGMITINKEIGSEFHIYTQY